MIRRIARVLILLTLIAIVSRDILQFVQNSVRYGFPSLQIPIVPPHSPILDQWCLAAMHSRRFILLILGPAALLAVLPRPRLYKLILLTLLHLALHLSYELAPLYHVGRGTITLPDGTLYLPPAWAQPMPWDTYVWIQFILVRTTLLAWLLWLIRPRPRRPRPGHCPNCDYSLIGATSDRCPECGVPTTAAPPPG